jgi:hypothetical protein
MHFLQRSTHFSKTCCRPLITSKFLASEFPFHGWKSPEIAWGEMWTVWRMFYWGSTDPRFQAEHRIQFNFREVGGALLEVHRLPREVLRKRYRHRTSTKFRLWVIRRVHELFRRPSYKRWGAENWQRILRMEILIWYAKIGNKNTRQKLEQIWDTAKWCHYINFCAEVLTRKVEDRTHK